jgi:hypothetical protein
MIKFLWVPLSLFLIFAPLENPAVFSGNNDNLPFGTKTGFGIPYDLSRFKTEDFLTGSVQLPPLGSPQEKPEEPESPVKGWWEVKYFPVTPTHYSKAGKGIIKAESVGGRSSLFKAVGEKEKNLPALAWGWKVSNVVRSAIETRKERFDAAARVMVVFGEEGFFKRIGKGEPSGFKIEYIWATRLLKGHLFDHPGEANCKVFVLESGEGKAGQWVYIKRNIHKDFKSAFGTEPPPVLAIGIQTDTDHSNEMVTTYYSEPVLRR